MKSKAFTLIEVLAVILIISILAVVTIPLVTNNVNKSRDKLYNSVINKILSASSDWAVSNTSLLPENGESITITLGTLQSEGYISTDLMNPKKEKLFPADMTITINYVKSSRDNEKHIYGKYDGDYLFLVNVNTGTYSDDINKEYTVIELNSSVEDVDRILYQDEKGNELSLKNVNIQIVKNGKNVASIDSSTMGIYNVYYSYKDSTDSFIRVFNVVDTSIPEITFPENDIVSTSVESFDLYENVSCDDNSGKCNLTITEGENEFYEALTNKELGNYVVTYSGSDESGNTKVKKRVIEIAN